MTFAENSAPVSGRAERGGDCEATNCTRWRGLSCAPAVRRSPDGRSTNSDIRLLRSDAHAHVHLACAYVPLALRSRSGRLLIPALRRRVLLNAIKTPAALTTTKIKMPNIQLPECPSTTDESAFDDRKQCAPVFANEQTEMLSCHKLKFWCPRQDSHFWQPIRTFSIAIFLRNTPCQTQMPPQVPPTKKPPPSTQPVPNTTRRPHRVTTVTRSMMPRPAPKARCHAAIRPAKSRAPLVDVQPSSVLKMVGRLCSRDGRRSGSPTTTRNRPLPKAR